MANVQHKDAPLGHRHATHNWSVANQAARENLAVTSQDVGKDCLQTDTSPPTVWKLVRVTGGVSWMNLGAQGMTTEQTQQLNDALAKATALGTQSYLVQTLTTDLTNERALEGTADQVVVDYSEAGKAKVRLADAARARAVLYTGATATPIPANSDLFTLTDAGPQTPADVGTLAMNSAGEVFILSYPSMQTEAP